ncbi:MAG: hypothetical protein KGD57_04565 [Candidatus Lokiarchaeota archaeon]|nr:hypothetical protein [Candidatus Lokiarchaeota archaeon]
MSSSKEVLSLIEQFENIFDAYQQSLKNFFDEIVQNLSSIWKNMKTEQEEITKLNEKIRTQNSELTELKTKSAEMDKKIEESKANKEELNSKIIELTSTLERNTTELKKPEFELESLLSNLNTVNSKIQEKETEKTELDQKKLSNEEKEKDLKISYSEEKMDGLEKQLVEIRDKNYFSSFLIEHSDAEVPEVEIIAAIMNKGGQANLEDLKKALDIPPIMAVRTIKQLAVKGIINLNEDTNAITMF